MASSERISFKPDSVAIQGMCRASGNFNFVTIHNASRYAPRTRLYEIYQLLNLLTPFLTIFTKKRKRRLWIASLAKRILMAKKRLTNNRQQFEEIISQKLTRKSAWKSQHEVYNEATTE